MQRTSGAIDKHILAERLKIPYSPRYTKLRFSGERDQLRCEIQTSPESAPFSHLQTANAASACPRSQKERGFTLIELLVVLAILGLLIGFVAPAMIRQLGSAKHKVAEQSIERLAGILDLYRLDVGNYPTTEQGLVGLSAAPSGVAGWDGPYIKDPNGIKDPWGRVFEYRSPSQRTGHAFDIVSLGADGRPGGDGEDADLINR
jgi:general secretion pathway protein G